MLDISHNNRDAVLVFFVIRFVRFQNSFHLQDELARRPAINCFLVLTGVWLIICQFSITAIFGGSSIRFDLT